MSTIPAWRKALRPARFRGVSFWVDSRDVETGRRTALHEFPGRDVPFIEDLGRKARSFAIEAYVLGDDYMPARDALLEACEKAEAGQLIVPWSGEVLAVCTGCRVRESRAEGGMAHFSLSFSESGEASTPTGSVSETKRAEGFAAKLRAFADTKLDLSFLRYDMPAPVLEDALAAMRTMADHVNTFRTIVADPAGLAGHMLTMAGLSFSSLAELAPSSLLSFFFTDDAYSISPKEHTVRAQEMLAIAEAAPDSSLSFPAGVITTMKRHNQQTIASYQQVSAVVEAARSAALSLPESRKEAALLRGAVCNAIDAVLETTIDDALHMLFMDLRTATVRSLANRGGELPDIVTFTPQAVLPSLVIAHQVQSSASLSAEAELLRRNKVRHPGFMPVQGLEVMRYA